MAEAIRDAEKIKKLSVFVWMMSGATALPERYEPPWSALGQKYLDSIVELIKKTPGLGEKVQQIYLLPHERRLPSMTADKNLAAIVFIIKEFEKKAVKKDKSGRPGLPLVYDEPS